MLKFPSFLVAEKLRPTEPGELPYMSQAIFKTDPASCPLHPHNRFILKCTVTRWLTRQDGFYDGPDEGDVDQLPEGLNFAEPVHFNDGLDSTNRNGVKQGHETKQYPNKDESGLPLPCSVPADVCNAFSAASKVKLGQRK